MKERMCLDELLRIQEKSQETYYPIGNVEISALASAIASEAMEIWAASGEWWQKRHTIDKNRLKEESIDILHFLLALWLKLEMNECEIVNLYENKMTINIERQKRSMSM